MRRLPASSKLYATFEQIGQNLSEMGERPHVHIVAALPNAAAASVFERMVSHVFSGDDVQVQEDIGNFRAADLLFRYFDGGKKNQSPEERAVTRRWRLVHETLTVS